MARPFASLHRPAGYGYDRPKQNQEEEAVAVTRRKPVVSGEQSGMATPQRRLPAGQLPDEVKSDIIDQNRQKRQAAFDKQQSGFAQSDRRLAAIKQGQLVESRKTSRADDMKNLLRLNTPPTAARPAVPVIQPAPPPMPMGAEGVVGPNGSVGPTAAPQRPDIAPSGQMRGPLGRAMQTQERMGTVLGQENALHREDAFKQAAMQPGSPEMVAARQSAEAAMPNSPENIARRSASENPLTSGQEQDTTAMQGRMQQIADVTAGRSQWLDPGRTTPGGVAGVAPGPGMVIPNAQPQPVARPPITPFVPTQGTPTRPVIGGPEGTSTMDRLAILAQQDPRLQTLLSEANRGQTALDTGNSLEQQKREQDLAAQRQQEVAVASAQNPPRTTSSGEASQPKPSLPPDKQARLDAAKERYLAAARIARENATVKNAQEALAKADAEWQRELNDVPKKTLEDMVKDFAKNIFGFGGGQGVQSPTTAPAQAPAPAPQAARKFTQTNVPPPEQRQVNDTITTDKGTFFWNGTGWQPL